MDKFICFIGDAFRVLPCTHYQAIICKKKFSLTSIIFSKFGLEKLKESKKEIKDFKKIVEPVFFRKFKVIEVLCKKAILVYMQILRIFFEAKEGCWLICFVVYVTKLSGMALAVYGPGLC